MRILVCVAYTPYPDAGGGRADVWRRIRAFKKLGHSVMLLNQFDPCGPHQPTAQDFEHIDSVVDARCAFPIKRSLLRTVRQLAGCWRRPWHAAKGLPSGTDLHDVDTAIEEFGPDLIWMDGPWLGEIATRSATRLGIPIAYRSHNVEHLYLRRQARASPNWRNRVAWTLASVGVKRYELQMMSRARRVLDISLDDLTYWKTQGVRDAHWLPPLPELVLAGEPDETVPGDIVFVGGLRLPNNVGGVQWIINEVLPILQRQRPDTTFSVVGSSPLPDLASELATAPQVRTFFDLPSVYPHLFGAKLLINPVSVGSGVQLKMLDMLMTDAPIVTRTQGTRGLPPDCVAEFEVTDSPEGFARAIARHIDDPRVDLKTREHSRRHFTLTAVAEALSGLATK